MKIGITCPYTWDVPGGVQAHVRDLAETYLELGYDVSVITPVDDEANLPPYAVSAGKAVALPYNGSVSRVLLGVRSGARVRRWLRESELDVLHVHEPTAPSVSLLACMHADGPIVATFHTSNPRSRALIAARGVLQPSFEKIRARIAVSEAARRTVVEHLGVDAVLIPNGVSVRTFADAEPLPGYGPDGRTVAFLGRIDEPRKGLAVLLAALPELIERVPDARLVVAGPGDVENVRAGLDPALRDRVTCSGWSPSRTSRASTAPGTSTARPTPARRASGSSCWRAWRPARRSSPATSRPSAACSRAAARASSSATATRPRWPTCSPACSPTPPSGSGSSRSGARWWPPMTGRCSRAGSFRCTRW